MRRAPCSSGRARRPLTSAWSVGGRRRPRLAAAVPRGRRPTAAPRPSRAPISRSTAGPEASCRAASTSGTRSSARRCRASTGGARHGQRRLPSGRRRGLHRLAADRTASSTCRRVRAFIRVFAPRRGEIVVDAEALDLTATEGTTRWSRPQGGPASSARSATPKAAADPVPATRRNRRAPDVPLEIDVLTLFPAMVEAPLAASIPGRIQERGLATIRRPRPPRVGHRSASERRRRAVRRRSGDGHAPGAGRRSARRPSAARIRS